MSCMVALSVMVGCEDCQLRLHSGAFDEMFGGSEGGATATTSGDVLKETSGTEGAKGSTGPGWEIVTWPPSTDDGTTVGVETISASGSEGASVTSGWGPWCGDGVVSLDEECDDGNRDHSDSCVECNVALCGDGFVQVGVEECDDGNQTDSDDCNSNCLVSRYVFVTRGVFPGDLDGVSGDEHCQDAADLAVVPISGTYKAWMADADPSSAPVEWFPGIPGLVRVYRTPCEDTIAWGDQFPAQLLHPIDCDEHGVYLLEYGNVWTNVSADGGQQYVGAGHCGGWTTSSAVEIGAIGRTYGTNEKWTAFGAQSCNSMGHLYCFQIGD